jgi:CHAT domain-containing protein
MPLVDTADEWISLAAGPLAAGSRTVWSTLWAVDDASAAQLKIIAYDNLCSAKVSDSKVRPLNEAQRLFATGAWTVSKAGETLACLPNFKVNDEMLREYKHPLYWAGFIAVGWD